MSAGASERGKTLQHSMAFILRTQSISAVWREVAGQATKVIQSYITPVGGAVLRARVPFSQSTRCGVF